MARIGYARVSSVGQSLAVQLDKLTACACDKIYQEKKSGATGKCPSLEACLDYVREGDTLASHAWIGSPALRCTCAKSPPSCSAKGEH